MNIEIIPKEKEPELTFGELANGSVFKFTGEDSDGLFWMKIGNTAMQVKNTYNVISVKNSTIINLFESHLVIKGK